MISKIKYKFFVFLGILAFLATFFLPKKVTAAVTPFNTLKPNKLVMGTNATFAPFESKNEKGEIVGFDVDIFKFICENLGVEYEIIDMPFESLLPAVGTKVDLVLAGLTATDERKKTVNFSQSYFEGKQAILTLKGKEIKNESSFDNLTVATQIGTTANEISKKLQKTAKNVKTKEYDEYDIMVEDLIKKRVDAVILDEIAAINQEKKHDGEIQITNGSVIDCPIENCCIAFSKQNEQLLKAVDDSLTKLRASKKYDELLEKHMKIKKEEKKEKSKNKLTKLKDQFMTSFIEKQRWKLYLKGLGITLTVTFFAAILGFILGIVLAILKISKNKKGRMSFVGKIASCYISVIRGTPVLVQLLIMWLVILKNLKNGVLVAIISFGLNSAAYVAEIIRGGINAVNKGQTEAGLAMGFSKIQTMQYIVLPQGLKNSIPALCNEFISLLKETAIVGYVALNDLTRTAFSISASTYQTFMPLTLTALMYFLVTKIISLILESIERKLNK